jgi:hypothetical protein
MKFDSGMLERGGQNGEKTVPGDCMVLESAGQQEPSAGRPKVFLASVASRKSSPHENTASVGTEFSRSTGDNGQAILIEERQDKILAIR